MTKTVYVRPEDEGLWEEAARVAKARRVSLSTLVARALGDFVADKEPSK